MKKILAKVMTMKKIFGLILLFIILSGCKAKKAEIKILIPDGIPAIALGGLFNDSDLNFKVVSGPDLLSSELLQDNYDIIVAPLTLGTTLYLKGKTQYKLDSIITLGNTYLVSKEKLDSLSDLEGKTIGAYGLNNAPDIILKSALAKENVKANIEYEASVNDVVSNRFLTNSLDYILTAEPVLSNLEMKFNNQLNIIDLQAVLSDEIEIIPQAAIFVKAGNYSNVVNKIANNINVLNDNPQEYANKLMTLDKNTYPTFNKLGTDIICKSIPRSNIKYLNAYQNKEALTTYYRLINQYNKNIFNDQIPDEDFYAKKQ